MKLAMLRVKSEASRQIKDHSLKLKSPAVTERVFVLGEVGRRQETRKGQCPWFEGSV